MSGTLTSSLPGLRISNLYGFKIFFISFSVIEAFVREVLIISFATFSGNKISPVSVFTNESCDKQFTNA